MNTRNSYGYFASDGLIIHRGSGDWESKQQITGTYRVEFNPPYTNTPGVVITGNDLNNINILLNVSKEGFETESALLHYIELGLEHAKHKLKEV